MAMTQTALWLPIELRDKLRIQNNPHGLGAEIRKRLEESFQKCCPSCGARLQENWVHCPSCGRKQ